MRHNTFERLQLTTITGVVRAPLLTTLMQVASRFLLVWGVVDLFPSATGPNPAYSTMLLAWSVTEVIRYSYFVNNLSLGKVPSWMTWLRYNTFFVLYPLGISSECWLVWKATGPAEELEPLIKWAYLAILAIYVPGKTLNLALETMKRQMLTLRNCCRLVYSVHAYVEAKEEGHEGSTTEVDEYPCRMRRSNCSTLSSRPLCSMHFVHCINNNCLVEM
jgi:hypothetical protein